MSQDLKATWGIWPFKSGAPALPVRSAGAAPHGFLPLSVSSSASKPEGGGCPNRGEYSAFRGPQVARCHGGGSWPASICHRGRELPLHQSRRTWKARRARCSSSSSSIRPRPGSQLLYRLSKTVPGLFASHAQTLLLSLCAVEGE